MRNYKNTLKILGIYLIGIGLTLAFLPWWGLGVIAALGAFLLSNRCGRRLSLGIAWSYNMGWKCITSLCKTITF